MTVQERARKEVGDNVIKAYLGKYAIPSIDKRIFDLFRDINIHMNLVIHVVPDMEIIKAVCATILIKDREQLRWEDVGMGELLDRAFSRGRKDKDGEETEFKNIYDPEVLIVTEFNEYWNSMFPGIVTSLIQHRLMENKSTVLILTSMQEGKLIPTLIPSSNFKVITVHGRNYVTTVQNSVVETNSSGGFIEDKSKLY